MNTQPIKIEEYRPHSQEYSCILLGIHPSRAYQQTPEGQRIIIPKDKIQDYKIQNPELLTQE